VFRQLSFLSQNYTKKWCSSQAPDSPVALELLTVKRLFGSRVKRLKGKQQHRFGHRVSQSAANYLKNYLIDMMAETAWYIWFFLPNSKVKN
jgi:hypothetical protein